MWCIKCQADVAAEMAPDNRRILCASCGSQIRTVPLVPSDDKTRQARELLERWSKNQWSEEPAEKPAQTKPQATKPQATQRAAQKPSFRVDEPHPDHENRTPSQPAAREFVQPPRVASIHVHQPHVVAPRETPPVESSPALTQRTHDPHAFTAPPPHFPGEPFPVEETPAENSSSKLQAFWGQMLAYAGVLALTVGAAFVLLGYFGGPAWQSYTPTGWLITTTGQMLLFLGVVTLVSGGMEQTTEEVARRIDRLGQRIIRIEWASQNHALKGPSIPAEQFQPGGGGQSQHANTVQHANTQEDRR